MGLRTYNHQHKEFDMRKIGRFILITVSIFILIQLAYTQEKLVLTLEKSLQIALAQNPYHLAAGERVESAESKLREAVAGFLPVLNSQGIATLDEKLFAMEFPSFIPGQPPQKVEVDFTRDYQFALSFSLPLFTGGRLRSGFRSAKYNLQASKEAVRQSTHITVFNTKRAFYGYLLAGEFLSVAREAVDVAEKHLHNVKTMYEVGMASKFDLLRAEVQVANLKPQLIKAKNNLKIGELSLKTILGLDLERDVEITGELKFNSIEPDLQDSLDKAIRLRPELTQLNFKKKMAGEMLKIAWAAHLPSVALSATYNFWGDTLNFRKDIWQNYYTVNLVFTMPIFNGFVNSARVAQSRSAIREIEFSQKGLLDAVKFEVRQAVLKIQEALETLHSQEKNVEQAQESLRIAELNYAEGLATSLDVSSVQAALSQAKTNYSLALFDYMMAMAELEKATGLEGGIE